MDEQWRTEKLQADYWTSVLIAHLILEAILRHKEEWQLGSSLCEGFQVEVAKIEKVRPALLSQRRSDIDRLVLIYMARLRRCYDAYAVLSVTCDSGRMAMIQNLSGEEAKGITQKAISHDLIFRDFEIRDHVLWSTPKLQKVLDQSRSCTSTLLECTPVTVTTLHALKIDRSDAFDETKRDLSRTDAGEDDISPNAHMQRTSMNQYTLRKVSSLEPYHISTMATTEGDRYNVFVEQKRHDCSYDDEACTLVHANMRHLAKQLQKLEPGEDSGLLRFKGLIKSERERGSYTFLYDLPSPETGRAPSLISLRDAINRTSSSEQVPPCIRLQMAQRVCSALTRLHRGGILHKNVQKKSVVFFNTTGPGHAEIPMWTRPYLVDSDFARPIRDQTAYHSSYDLEQNISQHPTCQGEPSESFAADHDIYALGVLLLEIGLWSPAMDIFTVQNCGVPPNNSTSPVKIQNRLKAAATTELRIFMGQDYAAVAKTCLGANAYDLQREEKGFRVTAAWISQSMAAIQEQSLDDANNGT